MTAPVLELHHPDDETLAAFVDDRANDETREKVIEHMTLCAVCRETVLISTEIAMEEAMEQAKVVPHRRAGRWIAPLAAAAAIGGAVMFVPQVRESVFGVSPAVLAEPAADLKRRTTPGRFAVALPYTRHWVDRGGTAEEKDATAKVLIRGIHGNNEQALRPDPRTSGVAQALVAEKYQDFSAAIADLKKALSDAGGAERDAIALDLAAALLARDLYRPVNDGGVNVGKDQDAHPDAQKAYDLAQDVWSRTKSPDAAWNLAAALQALGRDKEAIAAWQTYLKLDPNSEWSTEARSNIDSLTN
jgi:tetratricopeptide (TPR) repeat protein